jgi:glycosyltransferase involved in cell wall biosynthesis
MSVRLRIFVVVDTLPMPDRNAGDRRLLEVLSLLAKRHRVDLWAYDQVRVTSGETAVARTRIAALGVRVLPCEWKTFHRAMMVTQYHLGLFEFYSTAELFAVDFSNRQPGARVVIDSVDVHFARQEAGAMLGVLDGASAAETRRRELAAYRAADAVIAVSDDDAQVLREAGGIRQLFVVPLIVPTRERRGAPVPGELLFVGGFAHPPNVDGLLWFAREVWPIVIGQWPGATLQIVGGNAPPEIAALSELPGVTVHGRVSDVAPFLDRAAVSIAPLRYGAGMKGKVVEALSVGVPVVATRVGTQGIPTRVGTDILVSDDAVGFAEAILSLLRDPARAAVIGRSGQGTVRLFSPERVGELVDDMLDALMPRDADALRSWIRWLRSSASHAINDVRRRVTRVAGSRAGG